jgi:hypothetical protein
VKQHSLKQFALGFGLLWFAMALGLNVGLSVILERAGASALPALTLVNAMALAAGTAIASARRRVPLRTLFFYLLGSAVGVAICAIGESSRTRWSATTLYIVSSVVCDICVALFWSHANAIFDTRSAKQAFPRIGAAGTVGAALAGLAALALGGALGTRGLIFPWVASLLAAAAWALRFDAHARAIPSAVRGVRATHRKLLPQDRALVLALAIGFVMMTVGTYVGRYLYSWSLSHTYGNDAVAITKLNGLLNAISSVAAALIQLVVMPLLLTRWGIRKAMIIYPIALLFTFGWLAVDPGLGGGIAIFFATNVLRRAVQGPIETVLPTGLLATDASRTVMFMTAVGTPAGMMLASAVLLVGRASQASSVALMGLAISVLFAVVVPWRGVAYRNALGLRLAKGGSDLRQRLLANLAPTQEESMLIDDLHAEDPALIQRLETFVRAHGAATSWRPDGSLEKIALARLAEAYRLHASLARLPEAAPDDARWTEARELWIGSVRHRIGEDLRAVILVLRATTGNVELDRISRRIFDADARARSAAIEILDALCPDDLRPLLLPIVEKDGMTLAAEKASQRFGAPALDPIDDLLAVPDVWIRACTAYALQWLDVAPYRARLSAMKDDIDPFLRLAVAKALITPR